MVKKIIKKKICEQCGKEYIPWRQHTNQRFCNNGCWLKYQHEHKMPKGESARKYYRANKEKCADYQREYMAKNPLRGLLNRLRIKYKITMDDYNKMITEQNNCCAICKKPFDKKKPSIDHNHTTGKVRGLLCQGCNTLVGSFESQYAKQVMEYLK